MRFAAPLMPATLIRRYKRFLQLDEFQQGAYPGSTTGETYNAEATCWPLPLAELS